MKKLRVLTAAVIVLSMLFTVAFAAVNFGGETVTYTEGENLVVTVYSTEAITVDGGAYINVAYGNAWAYEEVIFAEDFANGQVYEDSGYISVTLDASSSSANSVSLTAGQKLFDVVFSATGNADAVGSTISFEDDECFTSNWAGLAYEGSIEVVAGATTITSTNYTDKNGKVWKNVPNATCTLNGVTGTSISGTIDINYTEGGEAKKATGVAATALEGLNLSNANVTFTVAIVGVPDSITVNSFVPNLTVN